jgi:hypothetical protein
MNTHSRKLSAVDGDYLRYIASNFGGSKPAELGQNAATKYLSKIGSEQRGDTQLRAMLAVAAISTAVLTHFALKIDDPKMEPKPVVAEGSEPAYGCSVEVDSTQGLDSAWAISEELAPLGRLGEVFDSLSEQARIIGVLKNGDILLVPEVACSTNPGLVDPIEMIPSE